MSRRDTIVGALGLTVLGCSGFGHEGLARARKTAPAREPRAGAGAGGAPDPRPSAGGGTCETFRPEGTTQRTRLTYASTPEWFRRNPALWVPTAETAGAGVIMMSDSDKYALSNRIDSFARLPELLDQARSLGTDTVYLVDWYEPAAGDPAQEAWRNKGDWMPRSDFGGEAAFRKALAEVHRRGGRVVLYAEAFALARSSSIGQSKGDAWTLRDARGQPLAEPYPGTIKPCPAIEEYARYMEDVARRLGGYGADGLFLDSYGFQQDLACHAADHGHPVGDPAAFNRGCLAVAHRMRAALQSQNRDGVMLCEGPRVPPMFEHVDATFDWGIHKVMERGLWKVQDRTDTYTTGYSIDDLHQLVACGAKLALAQPFFERPRGTSAAARVAERRQRRIPSAPEQKHYYAAPIFVDVHMWRNSAILAGIAVPGIDDVAPRRGQMERDIVEDDRLVALLDRLASRAAELDAAIGKRAGDLEAPTAHVQAVCRARAALSPWVDDGADIACVEVGSSDAVAWSFTTAKGTACTVANMSGEPLQVSLPRTGAGRELLTDAAVTGGKVEVPGHAVRIVIPA